MKRKVAVVTTHPIQVQAPWFKALAMHPIIALKVYFATIPNQQSQGIGFEISFEWDIDLLDGYQWELLKNRRQPPQLGSFMGLSTPGVLKVLYRHKPDCVIITGWNSLTLIQTLIACKLLGIPTLVRGVSNALKRRSGFKKTLLRMFIPRFDGFLTVGKANQQFLTELGIPLNRIFQCPYFVDNDRFIIAAKELRTSRSKFREAWQIPEHAVCFLYAGKLQHKKRILDLLKALFQVRNMSNEKFIHLLLIGTGELLDDARDYANRYNLPVTFGGFLNQSEIPRAYVSADCLVLPSDYGETWGLVVNEAMVCGLPAVISDRVGCGPDLVIDDFTGKVFPFGDISTLARILLELARNPTKLRQLGANARNRILEQYSVQRAVEGTVQAVLQLSQPTK